MHILRITPSRVTYHGYIIIKDTVAVAKTSDS